MSQDKGKANLLAKVKKALSPTPKQTGATAVDLKLNLHGASDSNVASSSQSVAVQEEFRNSDLESTVTRRPQSLQDSQPLPRITQDPVKIGLILSQPHSPLIIRRDIVFTIPLNEQAFGYLMHFAGEIARNCTMMRLDLNSTIGNQPLPIETAVTLGGRTHSIRSQQDFAGIIQLVLLRRSSGVPVPELRIRILVPPSKYDIVRPRVADSSLQVFDAGDCTPEDRDVTAMPPANLHNQQQQPTMSPGVTSHSSYSHFVEPNHKSSRSRQRSGNDDVGYEIQPSERIHRQESINRSTASGSFVGHPHSSFCCSRPESICSSASSTPESRTMAARVLVGCLRRFEPPIGKGTFGTVYRCVHKDTARQYALKIVVMHSGDESSLTRMLTRFEEEVQRMSQLRHSHVITYYGSVVHDAGLYIVMEYMPSGSVRDLITHIGKFSEEMTNRFAHQALSGLAYLHRRKVAHLDLRCSNLLLDQKGKLKVADFGCSIVLSSIITAGGTRSNGFLSTTRQAPSSSPMDVAMAPAYWLSPEVALGTTSLTSARVSDANFRQLKAVDIWSFGCVIVEMATQYPPFYDPTRPERDELEVLLELASAQAPKFKLSADASQELQDILSKIFVRDAISRPPAEDLKLLPFFRDSHSHA